MKQGIHAIKYRPEVDGLRAVAVIAVVLYHAQFVIGGVDPFVGGYIGVDVFFVISGYLITAIILKEVAAGTFSYASFYERRARRILPVLFVVMATTIPFAWLWMLPKAMKEYAGSAIASLFFSSNVWFWQEDSYTAEPSALKPLLHTWSLSVEEQFYLLFPPLVLLLWKVSRRHTLAVFFVLFLVSLLFAQYQSSASPDAAFFLLPARGWELLAGAILAKLELDRGRQSHRLMCAFMPAVGVLLLSISMIVFDHTTQHPSLITALPVLGTMLIIWYCTSEGPVTKVLGSKPFVAIGLVSYSFYLWHFPIFAFARIKLVELTESDKIVLILVALALSVVSYFAIERPTRNRKLISRRFIVVSLSATAACVLAIQTHVYSSEGATHRFNEFNDLVDLNYWREENEARFTNYDGCALGKRSDIVALYSECRQNEGDKSRRILVIGDSHARMLVPGLTKFYGKENIAVRTASGCEPYLNYEFRESHKHCRHAVPAAFEEIERINPELIVIAGFYRGASDAKFIRQQLENDLASYQNKLLIVGPLPNFGEEGLPRILQNEYALSRTIPHEIAAIKRTFEIEKAYRQVARDLDVAYVSPVETFCNAGSCRTKVGESPDAIAAWDYAHLTHKSSIFFIESVRAQIDDLLKNE
ncbi:MAG: acyltransferase family protein [Pseudomonadota bacterium]